MQNTRITVNRIPYSKLLVFRTQNHHRRQIIKVRVSNIKWLVTRGIKGIRPWWLCTLSFKTITSKLYRWQTSTFSVIHRLVPKLAFSSDSNWTSNCTFYVIFFLIIYMFIYVFIIIIIICRKFDIWAWGQGHLDPSSTDIFSRCSHKIFCKCNIWSWPWGWRYWDLNPSEIVSRNTYDIGLKRPRCCVLKLSLSQTWMFTLPAHDDNTPLAFCGWEVKRNISFTTANSNHLPWINFTGAVTKPAEFGPNLLTPDTFPTCLSEQF